MEQQQPSERHFQEPCVVSVVDALMRLMEELPAPPPRDCKALVNHAEAASEAELKLTSC